MTTEEQAKLNRLKMPDIGDLLDDRYRIQSVMATGGMGVILRAEQLPMQRPVAIKLLHPHVATANPKVVGRFQQEVQLAKLLNHPNTIRLYDFGESKEGLIYVAMEYLEGLDLKELLAEEGALAVGRAVEITRQMLDGLAEAHSHDFIHRDLKPSNVFISQNRRGEDFVKLLDFGIAKSLEGSDVDLTASGSICGTPGYVAPEYLRNESLEKASDVYAVGLMLLEMLTGHRVFKGDAPVQTMMMHLQIDPDIPPAIEQTPLARIIRKATEKQPEARYADADAMLREIEAIVEELPTDLRVEDYASPSEPKVSDNAITPPPKVASKLPKPPSSSAKRSGDRAKSKALPKPSIGLPKPSTKQSLDEDSSASIPEADHTPTSIASEASSGLHQVGPPPMPAGKRPKIDRADEELEVEEVLEPAPAEVSQEPSSELDFERPVEWTEGGASGDDQRKLLMIGAGIAGVALVAVLGVMLIDPGGAAEVEGSDEPASATKTADEAPADDQAKTAGDESNNAVAAADGQQADAGEDAGAKLSFDLDTEPSGATARVGERELGTTPLVYEANPSELPQTVIFELEGYRAKQTEITRDGSPLVVEVLEEKESEKATASAGGNQSGGSSRRGRSSSKGRGSSGESSRPKKEKISDEKVEQVLDEFLVE